MHHPFLKSYRLRLSPLSPIHIGSGEEYDPTNYVMEKNVLFSFDPGAVHAAFDAQTRQDFLQVVSQGGNTLQAIQKFFQDQKEALIPISTQRIPVTESIQKFYDTRSNNQLRIERMAFSQSENQPILPGSALKGAIRTALLDAVHDGQPLTAREQQEVERNPKKRWQSLHTIQDTLSNCLPDAFERDPMRLIRIRDAHPQTEATGREVLFAINRKESKGGKPSIAEGKGIYQQLECLAPMQQGAFLTELSFLCPDQAGHARDKLPPEVYRWDLAHLSQSCNDFYLPILRDELALYAPFLKKEWAAQLQLLLLPKGALRQAMRHHRVFLLRVGRHSGAESVTLQGARHIKIMGDKKENESWRSRPSTIWLAAGNKGDQHNMLPFGWLLVEVLEGSEASIWKDPGLSVLVDLFRQDWAARRDEADRLWEHCCRQQAEKKKESQQLQEKRAQQAQEEAAQQARLATLTPHQRKIETLRQAFEATQVPQPVSGVLWSRVNTLTGEAQSSEWSREARHALVTLCETHVPKKITLSKKKRKAFQDHLAQLRR